MQFAIIGAMSHSGRILLAAVVFAVGCILAAVILVSRGGVTISIGEQRVIVTAAAAKNGQAPAPTNCVPGPGGGCQAITQADIAGSCMAADTSLELATDPGDPRSAAAPGRGQRYRVAAAWQSGPGRDIDGLFQQMASAQTGPTVELRFDNGHSLAVANLVYVSSSGKGVLTGYAGVDEVARSGAATPLHIELLSGSTHLTTCAVRIPK
ncbi:MAG: hypothetical protein ACR2PL_08360 [Dehalococcoidia bacterium]